MRNLVIILLVLALNSAKAQKTSEHLQNLSDVQQLFNQLPLILEKEYDKKYEFMFDSKGKVAFIREWCYEKGTKNKLDSSVLYTFKLKKISASRVAINMDIERGIFYIEIFAHENKPSINQKFFQGDGFDSIVDHAWITIGPWSIDYLKEGELCVSWLSISALSVVGQKLRANAQKFHLESDKNIYPLPGTIQEKGDNKIIIVQMPLFNGAESKEESDKLFAKYINEQSKKHRTDCSGRVVVSFVVNKEGRIVELEVSESTDIRLNRVAIKLFRDAPLFIPAVQMGTVLTVAYHIPINFYAPKDF
jgi:TonB family protein